VNITDYTPPTPTPLPARTRLADIDPRTPAAARAAGRVTDVPDHRAGQAPVTFNSAA